jgi:hypothetical protein
MMVSNEERLATLEAGSAEMKKDLHDIKSDVKEMRTELAGRPSWAVTTIITMLSASCATLATLVATLS